MTLMNWSKSNYKKTISIVALLLGNIAVAYSQNIVEWQKKYSGYNELILQESQTYDLSVHKNKLKVVQDNYYESVILTEIGIHNTAEMISYSDLVPLNSYEAYSVVNIKGKDKKIPIKSHTDKSYNPSHVFHSDTKERKIVFTNLEVGAKKVYSYQSEFLDPCLLHKFLFANNLPIEKSRFEVIADKNIEIGYKIFNDPDNKITFSKTEKKGRYIYTWELNNSTPILFESDSPGYLYVAPHIVFYVQNYQADKNKVELLGSIDQLYKYYQTFIGNINQKEDANLKQITQEIIQGKTTDQEKIKAIFYWVKDNIKYVAFEDGYEGFIPREAALVNERRFGDCKDMSSIITQMAKYAAIPNVNICWIGTRKLPYSYQEVSTPAVDNHMIASIDLDGKTIFLDATDNISSFGLPSSFIQGKEALISNGSTYRIVEVPVVSGEINTVAEQLKVKLNGTTLQGNGTMNFRGLARTNALRNIGDVSGKARLEAIKGLVLKGNNKFMLKEYKEHNFSNRDLPYQIDFDFQLDNYVVSSASETYLSMFLDKPLEKFSIEKNRKSPFEFDILVKQSFSMELEIPKGKKVSYVPQNIVTDNRLLKYDITYTTTADKITLNFVIQTKKLLLDQGDFELWNQSIKDLKSNYNEMVVLTNL
jgi:transglutaminase-like putative cysteine protease